MAAKPKSIPTPVAPQPGEGGDAPLTSDVRPPTSARRQPVTTGLFVFNSFQYRVGLADGALFLKLADLADKPRPVAGDLCQLKPEGTEEFIALKISEVFETDDKKALEITALPPE